MLAIGVAILPRIAGWAAVAIGGVGLVAGLSALLPRAAYVRYSADGLTVKYAFQAARTVPWREIAAVTSELVPIVRHRLPSLVVRYVEGYSGPILGQQLDPARSYVGNFTVASGDELAAAAREYLDLAS